MVSEIIGEMLKLAIAVTMVALLSSAVYSHLPDERLPHIEVEIDNVSSSALDITHAGGDPVHVLDVHIMVANDTASYPDIDLNDHQMIWKLNRTSSEWETNRSIEYWKFGDTLHVDTNLTNISYISVIHSKAVLATAEVRPAW